MPRRAAPDQPGDEDEPLTGMDHLAPDGLSELPQQAQDLAHEAAGEPSDGLVRTPVRRRGRMARAAEPQQSRLRPWVIGAVVAVLLVALAAGLGWIYARSQPDVVNTQTQVATGTPFRLELPIQLGEFSRDANQGNTPNVNRDGKTTLSATYSKGGQPQFVLLLARPYDTTEVFMRDLNMNAISNVDAGMCGVSGDNMNDGCALIRDQTGILVLSTVDMSREQLMKITQQAADQLDV
ncbi:hypothetical protein ACQB6R_14155 [Propionibacteriaceae bacterium G1746]|uniref:hypothetical protein n=1 Tax=Aestuariimicrobium sp. G57 TaxID=3418485 RepID=UPI003C18FA34